MPATSERQRRAAGAELGRRRTGKTHREKGAKRPFAGASVTQLREFAAKPTKKKGGYSVKHRD